MDVTRTDMEGACSIGGMQGGDACSPAQEQVASAWAHRHIFCCVMQVPPAHSIRDRRGALRHALQGARALFLKPAIFPYASVGRIFSP
jgi:hypothetical protein